MAIIGHKQSEEHRRKLSEAHKGKKLSEEHKRKLSKAKFGKPRLEEVRKKISETMRGRYTGELASNWRGGLSSLKNIIRKCFEYRQWRSDVFTRDDYTCQLCGIKGGKIVADHINSFSIILYKNKIKTREEALACEELWNINNGRTLCQNCHEKTENYGGRGHIKGFCRKER